MRFLIDANLGAAVAACVAEAGHEALIAADMFPAGTPDPELARFAAEHRLSIITADRGFLHQFRTAGIAFNGALITVRVPPPVDPAVQVELLRRLWRDHPTLRPGIHYIVQPNGTRTARLT